MCCVLHVCRYMCVHSYTHKYNPCSNMKSPLLPHPYTHLPHPLHIPHPLHPPTHQSQARMEVLRHPCPVLHVEWSPGLLQQMSYEDSEAARRISSTGGWVTGGGWWVGGWCVWWVVCVWWMVGKDEHACGGRHACIALSFTLSLTPPSST